MRPAPRSDDRRRRRRLLQPRNRFRRAPGLLPATPWPGHPARHAFSFGQHPVVRPTRPRAFEPLADFGRNSPRPPSARSPRFALCAFHASSVASAWACAASASATASMLLASLRSLAWVCSSCPSTVSESLPVTAPAISFALPSPSRSNPAGLVGLAVLSHLSPRSINRHSKSELSDGFWVRRHPGRLGSDPGR